MTGACVTMPSTRPVAASNPAYLASTAPAGTQDYDTVLEDLSRDIKVHGVDVSAVPLTGALLETQIREDGFKEGLSQKEIDGKLAQVKKDGANNLCFSVEFHSPELRCHHSQILGR